MLLSLTNVEIPNFIAILNCQAPQAADVHQGQAIPGDTETTGPSASPATGRVRRLLPLIISCHTGPPGVAETQSRRLRQSTHLRDVLGEATYESLARKGKAMTTAEMVTYAFAQIEQARAELNAVSK